MLCNYYGCRLFLLLWTITYITQLIWSIHRFWTLIWRLWQQVILMFSWKDYHFDFFKFLSPYLILIHRSYYFCEYADLYGLLRYFDANTRASLLHPQTSSSSEFGQLDAEDSELRLAQLQHQLPLNEPTALMHLVEDAAGMDEDEDEDTRECKELFKNMKFFLSREVRLCSIL